MYFIIYDKRQDLIDKSKGKNSPVQNIVRVELRIKPRQLNLKGAKVSAQLENLESVGNLLDKLSITGIPTPDKGDDNFALFVYAAQHVGAQEALAIIKNQKKRTEYRKRLLGQAANCWKPDEYWARAILAIRKTLASIS